MLKAGIFEAKQNFSRLLEAVEGGEVVVIKRHGKDIVQLMPVGHPTLGLNHFA